jgi:hypothetical protein
MKMLWKIRLVLQGGLVHVLNDVRRGSPGWSTCEPGGIEKLFFSFEGTDPKTSKKEIYDLILEGMKEYNFFVEASRSLLGGKTKVKGNWFFGKIPHTNPIVGFVLKDSIIRIQTIDGQEYSGTSTVGWKQGIIGQKVFANIIRR